MSEIAHVEKPVCEYAKRRGFHVRKLQWIGRRGAPDRFFFGRGVCFWIEFKDRGKPLQDHQEREIMKMKAAGLTVFVIDNEQAGIACIDAMYMQGHNR